MKVKSKLILIVRHSRDRERHFLVILIFLP